MQTETITLTLPSELAKRYRQAPPEEQDRIKQRAEAFLQRILMTREEAAEQFKQLTEEMGAYAASQGWTDEMNETLLRGDYDHE